MSKKALQGGDELQKVYSQQSNQGKGIPESTPAEIATSATDPEAGGNPWGGRDRVRSLKQEP